MIKHVQDQHQHHLEQIRLIINKIPKEYKAKSNNILITNNIKIPRRNPDIIIRLYGYKVIIEIDTTVNGYNDDVSESTYTQLRNDDYINAGFIPIIVNIEQLKLLNIDINTFILNSIIMLVPIFRAKKRLIHKT